MTHCDVKCPNNARKVQPAHMAEKVEFLFKCVQDGKISSEQACAMLGSKVQDQARGNTPVVIGHSGAGPSTRPATTGALRQPIERKE